MIILETDKLLSIIMRGNIKELINEFDNCSKDELLTSLREACMQGNMDIVKFLVSKDALNKDDGREALLAALREQHFDIADYIIENNSHDYKEHLDYIIGRCISWKKYNSLEFILKKDNNLERVMELANIKGEIYGEEFNAIYNKCLLDKSLTQQTQNKNLKV